MKTANHPEFEFPGSGRKLRTRKEPAEFKIVALRECPTPKDLQECDTPEKAVAYWRLHIEQGDPRFDPEMECFVVLFLNTRRRVRGHKLLSTGTHDTILVSPSIVFRYAVALPASAILIMHNHPSGIPDPSEADIKVTRDLIRAGQLLKIDVVDHVIVGSNGKFCSLRTLGWFSS
jgi:DNA repair protein RadC